MSSKASRQVSVHRKEIVKSIVNLSQRHSRHQVFRDWVEMSAISIANAVDKAQFEQREARYLDIVKPNPRKKATFKHFQQAKPKRWQVSTAMWSSRETRECLNVVFNYSGSAWKHVVDLWESGLHASIANEVIAGGSQPLMPEHLRKKLVTGWKDSRFI